MITEGVLGIGLVTYKDSKYLNSRGEHELFNSLVNQLGVVNKNIKIGNLDECDLDSMDIRLIHFFSGIGLFLKSILTTQLTILFKSKNKKIKKSVRNILGNILGILNLTLIYFIYKITRKKIKKFSKYAQRQANISNNHIDILSNLNTIENRWIINLEDDIKINKDLDIRKNIFQLIKKMNEYADIKIINLSNSFSDYELGIEGIKIKKIDIDNENTKFINIYAYPVSNTVCATLYRTDVLSKLIKELKNMEKYVFIPIDHKLNISLHKMLKKGEIKETAYASLDPGMFIQGSIHG